LEGKAAVFLVFITRYAGDESPPRRRKETASTGEALGTFFFEEVFFSDLEVNSFSALFFISFPF